MTDTPVEQTLNGNKQKLRAGYVEDIYLQNLQHIANSSLILFLALLLLNLYSSLQYNGWSSVTVGFVLFLLVLSATFFKSFSFMLRAWFLGNFSRCAHLIGAFLYPGFKRMVEISQLLHHQVKRITQKPDFIIAFYACPIGPVS